MIESRTSVCSVGHSALNRAVAGVFGSAQTSRLLGASSRTHSGVLLASTMSRNVLLILADAAEAKAVRRSLVDSRDGPFKVEWVSGCGEAIKRLCNQGGEEIAAVVVDLFLPDSEGIQTFDQLLRASPNTPILVLSHLRDEGVARLAVQRGAQDYLLQERLDGYSLPKALSNMLERSAYAEALFLERERAQVTLNSIGDAVISTDVAGNVTYLNAVAESMTGWSRQQASGRPLQEVLHIIDGDSREPALDPLAMAILQNKSVGLSANCVLIRRDGYESAIEDTAAPIHDRRGQVTGAVIVFHDVGVARAMSLRMSYLAQHDFLTELPNRMLLNDRLTQTIALARRHGKSLALLFLDVDHFKRINDSLGHAIGDQLLKSIAQRLVACVRSSDTVSRQGGDEFVVLLSEVARAEDVALTADKILAAVSRPHHIDHQDFHITVSVGIGVYPTDGADAETLLKNADLALFHAKSHGRSNHKFFKPGMHVRVRERAL
jgi:diguanylate cyclase (GGDEF)-like protein/PAS domain S-box-containing protein